ncbi:hypothetical protein Q5P01_005139 [Channa striata]|uniref:Uncharacterized protein n=1 Tax=Channa striata TaxID=64152 RepID=A0AA88SZ53_CHASR|nr:hypothetical protein Q5P01_005139 [Channa striata]
MCPSHGTVNDFPFPKAGQCDQTLSRSCQEGRRALHITEEGVMNLQMQSGSVETHWGSYCGVLGKSSDFHRSLLSLAVWEGNTTSHESFSSFIPLAVAVTDSSVGTLWGGVSRAGFPLLGRWDLVKCALLCSVTGEEDPDSVGWGFGSGTTPLFVRENI